MKLYSIYDNVGEIHGLPMCMDSDLLAKRAVRMALRPGGTSALCLCPGDFCLRYVGEFDQGTGYLVPIDPVTICSCAELVERTNDE